MSERIRLERKAVYLSDLMELVCRRAGMSLEEWVDICHELPAVETVKPGHWICTEEVRPVTGTAVYCIHCSECGKKQELRTDTLTRFCANCGARMDGMTNEGI